MPFQVPTFNLIINIWRNNVSPLLPPSVITEGAISPGHRQGMFPPMIPVDVEACYAIDYLLLPALTDIRDGVHRSGEDADVVECPALTGRMYQVVAVQDVGKGYDNEYRRAMVIPMADWPVPYP